MDNKQNRFLSVSYQLYSIDNNGQKHLEEQTQQGRPFQFISGFGFSLDAFEQAIIPLEQGAKFDFTLQPDEAFGVYIPEGVITMEREKFFVNGKFDNEHIFPGAVITLHDSEEHQILARITTIDNDNVTLDTNHPLAGQTLQFTGLVLENREATTEEIQQMLNHMSHECCGCDDYGDGECGGGGCGGGCGHCH